MKNQMRPAFVVEIETPKKYILNGLWFGPTRAKRVVVWVHGLGSTMFSKLGIADKLVDGSTAVLMFNNRGHDKVVHLRHASGSFKKGLRGGAVHEKFTDCADDIQGAINLVRKQGVKKIYLAGHSTGCQKVVYWASKRGRRVRGIMLLGPVSDYSAMRLEASKKKIARALAAAQALVRKGKGNEILPSSVWNSSWIADAQRFLSLYSGEGPEEIFTYWDPLRNPRTLHGVKVPVLVLLAGKEEYAKIPPNTLAAWFEKNIRAPHRVAIIPRVSHSFRGGERAVAAVVKRWIKER